MCARKVKNSDHESYMCSLKTQMENQSGHVSAELLRLCF